MRKALIVTLLVLVELALLVAMVASVGAVVGPGWGWTLRGPFVAQRSTIVTELDLSLEAGDLLEVRNPVGRVTITGGSTDPGVKVTVTGYGATAAEARRWAEEVRVEASTTEDGQLLTVSIPRGLARMGPSDSAALDIFVPSGVAVVVSAGMGKVEIQDHVGDARITAAMGAVSVSGLEGNLDVDAKMGSVDVRAVRIAESMRIVAAMGSVSFSGALGRDNRITASMGSVAIRLDGGSAVDAEASAAMGSVSTSLEFVGDRDRNRLKGRIGTGEPVGVLIVTSSMGSINIR